MAAKWILLSNEQTGHAVERGLLAPPLMHLVSKLYLAPRVWRPLNAFTLPICLWFVFLHFAPRSSHCKCSVDDALCPVACRHDTRVPSPRYSASPMTHRQRAQNYLHLSRTSLTIGFCQGKDHLLHFVSVVLFIWLAKPCVSFQANNHSLLSNFITSLTDGR